MRTIPELIKALHQALPPWAFALVMAALAVVALPAWLNWVRTRQIKGALRRMVRSDNPDRRRAARTEAFDRAGTRPRSLVALADEGIKLNSPDVWREALKRLEATGKLPEDVRRIRAKVYPAPKRGGHPLEEVVIIERMWKGGLHQAALERLADVRKRFPDDQDLAELEQRLSAADG